MFNKQTKKRAKSKPAQLKYKRNLFGLFIAYTVSAMLGAVGVAGWLLSGDGIGPLAFAGLAAGAAFVIPICAGQVSRGGLGWLALAPALVFAGWSAYSIENANRIIVEAPHKAEHDAAQATVKAAVATAQARLDTLQDKRINLQPEVVACDPCRQTKADAAVRDNDRKADLDKLIADAKLDLAAKQGAVVNYVPQTDWRYVLAFGALIDAVLALLVFSLEQTAEQNRRLAEKAQAKHEQAKQSQPRAQRQKPVVKVAAPVDAVDPLTLLTPGERRALLRVV